MNISIEVGLENEMEFTVKEEDTAKFIGSGDVAVLSTPAMIAMMENTARLSVENMMPNEYTTVGTRVDIAHLHPAPVGAIVKVKSKLVRQEGRKLVFEVKAYWRDIKIGEGLHERFIVHREKFLKKVKELIR